MSESHDVSPESRILYDAMVTAPSESEGIPLLVVAFFGVVKPGGHVLVCAAPQRSHHRAMALEDAGFEIRDVLTHHYGRRYAIPSSTEHWILARKPLSEPTVAANVLRWGTGGINLSACRVGTETRYNASAGNKPGAGTALMMSVVGMPENVPGTIAEGRFPANLLLTHAMGCIVTGFITDKGYALNRFTDGAKPFGNGAGHPYTSEKVEGESIPTYQCADDCPVRKLNAQSGQSKSGKSTRVHEAYDGESTTKFLRGVSSPDNQYDDSGGAARFFSTFTYGQNPAEPGYWVDTIHSLDLVRWLVRLITPPGGLVYDPFDLCGVTRCAAYLESFQSTTREASTENTRIALDRLDFWKSQ